MNPVGGGPIEGVSQLGAALNSQGHQFKVLRISRFSECALSGQCLLPVYALGPTRLDFLQLQAHSVAARKPGPLRRGDRQRHLAVSQFCGLAGLANSAHALRRVHPRHARSVVQAAYPFKHLKKWMYWPWAEYRVLRDAGAVLFTCEEERVLARQSFWLYRCNGWWSVPVRPNLRRRGSRGLREFLAHYPELRGKAGAVHGPGASQERDAIC